MKPYGRTIGPTVENENFILEITPHLLRTVDMQAQVKYTTETQQYKRKVHEDASAGPLTPSNPETQYGLTHSSSVTRSKDSPVNLPQGVMEHTSSMQLQGSLSQRPQLSNQCNK